MDLSTMIATTTSGGLGIFIVILTIIQIAPIKVNPWSFIAKKIGKAMNGEVITKVDKINSDLKELKNVCDEREANACRVRILRFNDEILHDIHHTKEHFDQILIDITAYEDYCRDHPKYKNHVTLLAIDNIRKIYKECEDKHDFL